MMEKFGDWIKHIAGMIGSKYNKKKRKKEDGGDPNAVSLPRAMQDMADMKKKYQELED